MHLFDTVEVMRWKTKIRAALAEEKQHREESEEIIKLKLESQRLNIKIPDVLTRPDPNA